jgi:hypothetical protein
MNHGEAPSEPFIANQLGYMLKKRKEKKKPIIKRKKIRVSKITNNKKQKVKIK